MGGRSSVSNVLTRGPSGGAKPGFELSIELLFQFGAYTGKGLSGSVNQRVEKEDALTALYLIVGVSERRKEHFGVNTGYCGR